MSVEEQSNESQEVQNQEQESQENQEIDVNKVMARLEQLEQTNQRLLDESKTYKSKWQGLRSEVEKENEQRLTEKENWKELLEIEKNKNFEAQEKLKNYKKQTLQQKLQFEVAKNATNAFDVNDVIKSLPSEMIEIDEESLEIRGINEAVDFVKNKKPYLFNNKKSTGMVSNRPAADDGKKSYDDLSQKEKDDLFLQALDNL